MRRARENLAVLSARTLRARVPNRTINPAAVARPFLLHARGFFSLGATHHTSEEGVRRGVPFTGEEGEKRSAEGVPKSTACVRFGPSW